MRNCTARSKFPLIQSSLIPRPSPTRAQECPQVIQLDATLLGASEGTDPLIQGGVDVIDVIERVVLDPGQEVAGEV